jgi:hypothetical protein
MLKFWAAVLERGVDELLDDVHVRGAAEQVGARLLGNLPDGGVSQPAVARAY